MTPLRKRTLVALSAGVTVLVLAAAAFAAGPPASAPHFGQQVGAAQGYGPGPGHGLMAGGVVVEAAADYIGIDESALAAARHDGKSLSQIAVEHGKTVAGLRQAVVAAFETRIQAAVAAGTLTQAQADQVRTQFEAQLQTMLDRTATGPVGGRGMGLGLGLGACGMNR